MNGPAVTLKEIADVAGCSTRLVSAVLNPGTSTVRVGEGTQRRIMEIARERGYRPNQLARAVATGKSRVLGLVTDSDEIEHKAYMLAGAIEAANARDYLIKVLPQPYRSVSNEPIEKCIEWRLAGLLAVTLSTKANDFLRENTAKLHVPLALLDNVKMYDNCVSVVSDDLQGMRLVISHLVELGHTRIGFLGGDSDTPASMEREIMFRDILKNHGLPVREEWIAQSDWGLEYIIEPAARSLIADANNRPTAVVCAGDPLAMMMCRVARQAGLNVPRDLSVVGFANFYLSRFCDPPLTTVEQPFREMARLATERLIALSESGMNLQSVSLHERLPTRLVTRGSTGPPPKSMAKKPGLAIKKTPLVVNGSHQAIKLEFDALPANGSNGQITNGHKLKNGHTSKKGEK